MIHAMIDIGSNTIRMAIYQIEQGHIDLLMKKKHLVGLAAYIEEGVMQQEGIDQACAVLQEYREFLASFQISEITAFTTAALRNVKNSDAAVSEIIRRTGIDVRVISGDEEATYDFIGATHDLQEDSGILIDIGGASTEIVFFAEKKIIKKISLPMGSLMFHTKYVEDLLPSTEEMQDMRDEAKRILASAVEFADVSHVNICGIGGTFKGAAALYNYLYHEEKTNTCLLTERLQDILLRYRRDQGIALEDTIALMKTVPERMHTIFPGLIIAGVLARKFGSQKITYSDSGVREGYIYDQILSKA